MKKYDAIVVGAGSGGNIGALALQKGGKNTLLIEKHNITGGTGSSFRRGRFEFETALHQLYGITDHFRGDKGALRKIFEDLGIYDQLEFVVQHETFRLAVDDQLSVPVPGSYEGFKNLLKKGVAPGGRGRRPLSGTLRQGGGAVPADVRRPRRGEAHQPRALPRAL